MANAINTTAFAHDNHDRLSNPQELKLYELDGIHGGQSVPSDLIVEFVSCYLGICGYYPFGTRTDEYR